MMHLYPCIKQYLDLTFLEYCIQAWSPYLRKGLTKYRREKLNLFQDWEILDNYEEQLKECGLTTLDTIRLRGDQMEVFKILNGYENIDSNIFCRN